MLEIDPDKRDDALKLINHTWFISIKNKLTKENTVKYCELPSLTTI
jgi:hypothetical protein